MNETVTYPKHSKSDGKGGLLVTLKKGISIDGTEVKEVNMREPLLRDQLQATKAVQTPEDREIYIIALVTGQSPSDIETISAADWNRLQEAYQHFID